LRRLPHAFQFIHTSPVILSSVRGPVLLSGVYRPRGHNPFAPRQPVA
jgi:hypothetical protein